MCASPSSWTDLSLADSELLLLASNDTASLRRALSHLLHSRHKELPSSLVHIELDLYAYALLFAASHRFTAEQTSAFFTILKSLHELCVSSPYDNLHDALQFFKQLLLRFSVNRPPFSSCLYSIAEASAITDYLLSTYFKFFKLYKYCFTKKVQLDVKLRYGEELGEEEAGKLGEEAGPEAEGPHQVEGVECTPATCQEEEEGSS